MPAPKKNPLTNLIKKGVKKAVTKSNPKSNVKVKPAAKQKGNPRDASKDFENLVSSISRGAAPGSRGLGKARDKRVARSKNQTGRKVNALEVKASGTLSPSKEGINVKVSPNVTARLKAKSNYGFVKDLSRMGKIQAQNALPLGGKAESKATKRALKAANKKKK